MNHAQFFILAIIAISTLGAIAKMWVRARHGWEPIDYKQERARLKAQRRLGFDPAGNADTERKVALLSAENERLTGQISRLEERIAVLERIATDPAERVARDIDALR